jgi:hypothetical protein
LGAREDREDVENGFGGDVSAFERLFCGGKPLSLTLPTVSAGSWPREDLAQEAFLRIYRDCTAGEGMRRFSTWLFAVATNCYRSSCEEYLR